MQRREFEDFGSTGQDIASPVVEAFAVTVLTLAIIEGVRVHAQESYKGVQLSYTVLERGA